MIASGCLRHHVEPTTVFMRPDFGYSNRGRCETDGKPNGAKALGCIGSPTLDRRSTVQ